MTKAQIKTLTKATASILGKGKKVLEIKSRVMEDLIDEEVVEIEEILISIIKNPKQTFGSKLKSFFKLEER